MRSLLGLPLAALAAALAPHIDRPFRARQVYDAIHRRGQLDFEGMTDLAQPLRAALAERFDLALPAIASTVTSSDGTSKYLLRLADGASIEAVDIPDRDRRTLCISSQAGCGLACAFCVTGFWGAGRNLTASEIVGQVFLIRRVAQLPPGVNLVFMGMGEPLLNLDAVRDALTVLSETVSWRRVTVSTAGVVPGIDQLGTWAKRPNLAVSLHAADDRLRSELMPINRTYPLAELMAALRRYPLEARRRITIEFTLIRGVNDDLAQADALARLLRGLPTKINLIPFNPDRVLPATFAPPEDRQLDAFRDRLEKRGYTATVRRRRGGDVAAACGQLRAFDRSPRGPRATGRLVAGDPRSGKLRSSPPDQR
ncbi:MAG: 23S rRNA (adenine(2503)-C(2))-methyltransferase RlmN [Thermoanaerobaculia bacterium]